MTSQRTTPYPVRLPKDLRRSLEQSAASHNRSLHAEIIHRLSESLHMDDLNTTDVLLDSERNDLTNKTMMSIYEELRSLRKQINSKEFARRLIKQGFSPLSE